MILERALAAARARVARSDRDLGPALAHYESALPAVLAAWDLRPTSVFPDGVGMPTLAVDRAGTPAVLKLALPGELDRPIAVMGAADGRGYARVLDRDLGRGAVLLERLGDDLWSAAADLATHARVTVPLLQEAWQVSRVHGEPGTRKAAGLLGILEDLGSRDGEAHLAALDLARRHAAYLVDTETEEVVCHGDPHGQNVLRRGAGWALVDPDGFLGERAYDLGVVLRDGCREVLAAEDARAGSGVEVLRSACSLLADLAGVDADRVWAWGYVERVTTGLYLHWLGHPEEGESFLAVADLVASAGGDDEQPTFLPEWVP